MIHETINYTEDGRVNLQTYIPEVKGGPLMPALISCPGGAWTKLTNT